MLRAPNTILEIQPTGGIISRLRAMASALVLAEDISRSLVVAWKTEPGVCVGEAKKLFDLSRCPVSITFYDLPDVERRVPNQCAVRTVAEWEAYRATVPPMAPYEICSDTRFYGDDVRWARALQRFWFAPQLYRMAMDVFRASPAFQYVGVHLRTQGRPEVQRASPTAAFLVAMRDFPPHAKFLIASDDERERAALTDPFPGRTLTAAVDIEQQTSIGTLDTILDFLALTMCTHILGPVGSSFAETAAAYGGKPLYKVAAAPPTPKK